MNTVWCGWREARAVSETLLEHAEVVADWPWMLVTSVDSNLDVAVMDWAAGAGRSIDGALLVPGSVLIDLIGSDDVLYGFDELWFCEAPPLFRPTVADYLVAPRRLEDPLECARFAWLTGSSFVAGVGDGYGMNYVSRDRDLLMGLDLEPEGQ